MHQTPFTLIRKQKAHNVPFTMIGEARKPLQTLFEVNKRLESQLDFLDLRRNLVIKNLDIKILDKKNFTIATATFKILRYAPPCRYLSRLLGIDMMQGLKYIGGYRAKILTSGKIKLADILKLT